MAGNRMVQRKHIWKAAYVGLVIGLFFSVPAFANSMNVETRTIEQIRERINNGGVLLSDPVEYAENPVTTAPYSPGKLSDGTLQSAITVFNNVRYIAGLSADVELKDEYNELAQACSLLNCVNGSLSHSPSKPDDMDDSLYQLGYEGASSCNISSGRRAIGSNIVNGWMADASSSSNLSSVGHRRWILNPRMKYTGFGAVNAYMAMYAFDSLGTRDYTNVAWPAQNMPAEYFSRSYPWSLSTGTRENADSINVTLTKVNDGTTWAFNSSSSDGLFYVNNSGYGLTGCIIFRPENVSGYRAGDQYHVKIEGLKAGTLEYDVNFFDLKPITEIRVPDSLSVAVGEKLYLNSLAEIVPDDASDKKLIWTTDDPEIASIEEEYSYAYLNGISGGDTILTVSNAEGTVTKNIQLHVHDYEYLKTEDGLACFQCKVCSDNMSGKVPTSYRYYWKDAADTYGYYWSYMPSPMDVGSTLAGMVDDISYTGDSDNCFDEFVVELSDPEAGTIEGSANYPRITWKKNGSFKVVVYPKYNPSKKREYSIRIVKPVESVSLRMHPEEKQRYDSEVTLTAEPDGGKGKLLYRFVLIDDGKEEVLKNYGEETSLTWTADRTGMVGFRVDVMDQGDQAKDENGNPATDENGSAIYVVKSSDVKTATLEPAITALAEGAQILDGDHLVYGQKISDLVLSEAVLTNLAFENADTGKKVAGSLTFSKPDAVPEAGSYEAEWTFTPGDENYLPVQGKSTVEVDKANPVIFKGPELEQIVYHPTRTLEDVSIPNGEESVPGTWRWKNGTLIPEVGTADYLAVFVPADQANYNLYETGLALNVVKALPVLSTTEASGIVYGQPLGDSQLRVTVVHAEDPGTEITGSAEWEEISLIPWVADSETTAYRFLFTPDDTDHYETVEGETTIRVQKAQVPPDVPDDRINLPYRTSKVSDEIIQLYPEWTFSLEVQGKDIPVGETIIRVRYVGEDAENYELTEKDITLFRSSCEHETTEVRNEKEATCTKDGYSGDTWCVICGEKTASGKVIDALGHQPESINAVPATCEGTGLTDGSKCSRCGEILKAQEEIPAAGHEWSDDYTVDREPTCTEAGSKSIHCKNCTATKDMEQIPALGHTAVSADGENGKEICSVCGRVLKESSGTTTSQNEEDKAFPTPDEVTEITESQLAALPVDLTIPKIDESKIKTSAMNGKRMRVIFSAVNGAENYVIAQRGVKDSKWRYFTTGAQTTYILKNLKAKSLVQFKVAAYRDGKIGGWSNVSYRYYVKTKAKIKAGKNRFTATFKKVKGATGYQISYSLKKNMSGKKTVTSKSLKKVVKKLKKGRKYYIQYRPVKKYKGKTYLGIMRSATIKVR